MKKVLLFTLFLLGAQQAVAMEKANPTQDLVDVVQKVAATELSWEEAKEEIRQAILNRAKINLPDDTMNPLFQAVINMDHDFASWLMLSGANPNLRLSPKSITVNEMFTWFGFEDWLSRQNPSDVTKMKELLEPGRFTKPAGKK